MDAITKVRAKVFENGIDAIVADVAVDAAGNLGPRSIAETTRRIQLEDLPKDLATRIQADMAELDAWILADTEAKDESPLKRYLPVASAVEPVKPIGEVKQ